MTERHDTHRLLLSWAREYLVQNCTKCFHSSGGTVGTALACLQLEGMSLLAGRAFASFPSLALRGYLLQPPSMFGLLNLKPDL